MYFYYSSYLFESRPLNWSKWLANLDLVTEFVTKTIILLDTVYLHLTCLLSAGGPWTRSIQVVHGLGPKWRREWGGGGSPYVLSSSSMECNICVSQLPLVTRIMPLRKLPVFFINRYLCFLRTILAINRNKKLFYLKFLCTSLNLHLNFCPFVYFFLVKCSRQIPSDSGDGGYPTGTPSSGVRIVVS